MTYDSELDDEIDFTWLGCRGENEREGKVFSVSVSGSDGTVLSKELIPFVLKRTGLLVIIDGIQPISTEPVI